MNEKLNIQNLTDELAETHGLSKKNAESFVKDFFSLIEEALEKDKYVKVKGLGTFKLIDVDSRESINVNTGERFEIQGHSKISFTPDNSLKEVVNKPFSAFETVVLADGVEIDTPEVIGDTDADIETEEVVAENPMMVEPMVVGPVVEEPASEIEEVPTTQEEPNAGEPVVEEPKPIVEGEVPVSEEPIVKEESVTEEPEPVIKESIIKDITPVVEEKPSSIEEPVVEDSIIKQAAVEEPIAEDQSVKILPIFDDDEIKKRDQPVSHQEEVKALRISDEKRREISKKAEGSSTPYLMFIAVLIIMLCLGAVAYLYYPDIAKQEGTKPVRVDGPLNPVQSTETSSEEIQPVENMSQAGQVTEQAVVNQPENTPDTPVDTPVTAKEQPAPTPQTTPAATQTTTNEGYPRLEEGVAYVTDGELATHTLQKGETLNAIARKYYGVSRLYTYIVNYNKDVIKDQDNVPVGTIIRIPKLVKK